MKVLSLLTLVVLMTVHLTNLHGKVFKNGVMRLVFLKVMATITSNQLMNQNTSQTLIQLLLVVTTLCSVLVLPWRVRLLRLHQIILTHYVIVDSVVPDQDNVVSVGFADHEASYLAGVAAPKSTKTNHVGFIGGMEGVIIDRFEAGFVAGAKSVNKDIKITVDYAGSFGDAAKGQTLAFAQYLQVQTLSSTLLVVLVTVYFCC